MNLAQIDLNLLVALNALLEECHVTRAAQRVGLSQPAMSNALGRLRAQLDDPLLVRIGSAMAPTPRALELAGPIKQILEQIELTLTPNDFAPAESARTFTLGASDYMSLVILPRLSERFSREAPRATLKVIPVEPGRPSDLLREDRAEVVIGFEGGAAAPGLCQETLFQEHFLCVQGGKKTRHVAQMSLDEYSARQHMLVTLRGDLRGIVDRKLEELGRSRHVALTMPHFLAALSTIKQNPTYILTLPSRVALHGEHTLGLNVFPPPLQLPTFTVAMYWDERTALSPAHRWLRQLVIEVSREL